MNNLKRTLYTIYSKIRKNYFLSYKELHDHLKKVNDNSKKIENKKEIIVFSPVSDGIPEHWFYKTTITKGLAPRGIKVVHGQCNHDFPICDLHLRRMFFSESEKLQALFKCGNCRAVNETVYKNTDMSYVVLSNYIDKASQKRVKTALSAIDFLNYNSKMPIKYDGVDLQEALFATLRGFPRGAKMPLKYLKQFFETVMLATEAYSKIYQELKPDYLLIFN
ncbi:MAG: hypothetical protein WC197_03225, partial [Candidatus Gastranaerophilaceae bacterium]